DGARRRSAIGLGKTSGFLRRDRSRHGIAHARQAPGDLDRLVMRSGRHDELLRPADRFARAAIDAFAQARVARTFKAPRGTALEREHRRFLLGVERNAHAGMQMESHREWRRWRIGPSATRDDAVDSL